MTLIDLLLLILVFVVTIGFGQYCFRALLSMDWIIARLYTDHRKIWDQEGKPGGWSWRSPEKAIHIYGSDSIALFFKWSAREPEWMSLDQEIKDKFKRTKKFVKLFWIGIPVIMMTAIAAILFV